VIGSHPFPQIAGEVNPSGTVFVFPTPLLKRAFRHYLQSRFPLADVLVLSPGEFTARVGSRPQIRSPQRNLLLYAAIPDDIREKYRITDFFSGRAFVADCLRFHREVGNSDLETALDEALSPELTERQREMTDDYRRVLVLYTARLQQVDDPLFPNIAHRLPLPCSPVEYPKLVSVNITEPDWPSILAEWEATGGEVTEYLCQPVAPSGNLRHLTLVETTDDRALLDRFLHDTAEDKGYILSLLPDDDGVLAEKPYGLSSPIVTGAITRYLKAWQILLSGQTDHGSIRIESVTRALSEPIFVAAHLPCSGGVFRRELREALDEEGRIYTDTGFSGFAKGNAVCAQELRKLSEAFSTYLKANTPSRLSAILLALPKGIAASQGEWKTFWTAVDELQALSTLIDDSEWQRTLGAGTLRWFIEYLSFAGIALPSRDANFTEVTIDDVFLPDPSLPLHVLGLQEERLSANGAGFPWTAHQRELLHLPGEAEAREQRRQILSHLILSAESAVLYYRTGSDTTPAGLIAELYEQAESAGIPITFMRDPAPDYHSLLRKRYPLCTEPKLSPTPRTVIIPLDSSEDFPDGTLRLSFTGYKLLRDDPAEFYLRNRIHLLPAVPSFQDVLSPLVLGNLFHEAMAAFLPELDNGTVAAQDHDDIALRFDAHLGRLVSGQYRQHMPAGSAQVFFSRVLRPAWGRAAADFIMQLPGLLWIPKEAIMRFEPEHGNELYERELLGELPLKVSVIGRPDLTMTIGPMEVVVDFKTGAAESLKKPPLSYQLYFYQFLRNLPEDSSLFFYAVANAEFVRPGKLKQPLAELIAEVLNNVFEAKGFEIGNNARSPYRPLFPGATFDASDDETEEDE
jgi:hypothetical protein